MDTTIDDDICILTHEKADCIPKQEQQVPFSSSSEETSVASHFALVTAYEDIKKRLKDTEKENCSLKKRLRQLEERLCRSHEEEPGTVNHEQADKGWVGGKQVSKAYSAYREICIERDKLRNKLDMVEKEKLKCTKALNEQLQSKEVELLQVKSELETHQVMKSLSKTPSDWEIEKLNNELKMRSLEQEVRLFQEECRNLKAELQRTKDADLEKTQTTYGCSQGNEKECESNARQAYWELKKEMSNLHVVTEVQTEVLRKLKGTITATKKASQSVPVPCQEDLVQNCSKLRVSATNVNSEKGPLVLPNQHKRSSVPTMLYPHEDTDICREKADVTQWANERLLPVDGTDCEDTDFSPKSSFEENSWVIPSPPKPSETLFWETKGNSSTSNVAHYYNHNYSFNS